MEPYTRGFSFSFEMYNFAIQKYQPMNIFVLSFINTIIPILLCSSVQKYLFCNHRLFSHVFYSTLTFKYCNVSKSNYNVFFYYINLHPIYNEK